MPPYIKKQGRIRTRIGENNLGLSPVAFFSPGWHLKYEYHVGDFKPKPMAGARWCLQQEMLYLSPCVAPTSVVLGFVSCSSKGRRWTMIEDLRGETLRLLQHWRLRCSQARQMAAGNDPCRRARRRHCQHGKRKAGEDGGANSAGAKRSMEMLATLPAQPRRRCWEHPAGTSSQGKPQPKPQRFLLWNQPQKQPQSTVWFLHP